jgi:hypothetical protein
MTASTSRIRGASPEIQKLYLNIQGIQEQLSWALDGDSTDAIEIHCQALHSEVERIEGAAAGEARMRGWDLNVIKGLVQGVLESTSHTLRDADRAFCDLKAAFCKELDWELQAFTNVNTELELYRMLRDERRTAHLRAEKVGAAAHHAERAVERVLWDYNCRWREPQRLGLDHHQPIRPEESWARWAGRVARSAGRLCP